MTYIGTIGSYTDQTINVSSTLNSLGINVASLTINDFIFTVSSVRFNNTYSSNVGVPGGTSTSGSPSFTYSNGVITCKNNNANFSSYIKVWVTFNIYLK